MAQLVDIQRLEVGPQKLRATVRIADSGPLMTSDDLEGTTRVYNLMPHIIEHVCLGDAGETFRDVMGNTELAHLLEHMSVELLAQSGIAGEVSAGRTRATGDDGRTFEIELACPDDVLVAGALASACWMMTWAFGGGGDPEPDVEATVAGLVSLVGSLPKPEAEPAVTGVVVREEAVEAAPTRAPLQLVPDDEPPEPADDAAPEEARPAAPRVGETSVERPPRESPEARQAATDEFAAAPESHAELANRVQRDAGVTGSMPDAQSVR